MCSAYAIIALLNTEHIMTNEDQLIDLCDAMKIALDLNYLRGTVTVGRKKFTSVEAALEYVLRIKNF